MVNKCVALDTKQNTKKNQVIAGVRNLLYVPTGKFYDISGSVFVVYAHELSFIMTGAGVQIQRHTNSMRRAGFEVF